MPTISLKKKYRNGARLTETILDDFYDSLETAINVTGIDSDNLQNSTLTTQQFNEAETVTSSLDFTVGNKLTIANGGITTAQLNNSAVTSAKTANYTITTDKRADYPTSETLSSPSPSTTVTSGANAVLYGISHDQTTAAVESVQSISYTSTGRPVVITPIFTDQGRRGLNLADSTSGAKPANLYLKRGTTFLAAIQITSYTTDNDGEFIPQPMTTVIDFPPAGSVTYEMTLYLPTAASVQTIRMDLNFREL